MDIQVLMWETNSRPGILGKEDNQSDHWENHSDSPESAVVNVSPCNGVPAAETAGQWSSISGGLPVP
jgi:hypothetical protein